VIKIEKYPLRTSNSNVAAAKDFFPVLNTFVVPILPEPIFLISFPRKNFVIISPKGIDPNK
jgi:hypothetical protein